MLTIGLDIGGANTKGILLKGGEVQKHWLKYIPLWKEREKLGHFLNDLGGSTSPDAVGVTMTAELCDVFINKREGILEVTEAVCEAFGDEACFFMTLDGDLIRRDQVLASPEILAAANWVASALVVGREYPECLLIDVGSTTTDIIPIKGGKPATVGRTDFERLKTGELVYTGVLRTPAPFICSKLRIDGGEMGLASEKFAIMADVYRVLGELDEDDYTCETPDDRGKDTENCMRRIARMLCSDLEEIGAGLVVKVAKYLHDRQVALVAGGLKKVMRLNEIEHVVVGCGLGRRMLIEDVVRSVNLDGFIDLMDVYGEEAALMTPAFSVGVLAKEAVDGSRS